MKGTFYTISEVSDLLKVSTSTIRRSIRSGHLQVIRVGTQQQIRISDDSLLSFVNSPKNQSGTEIEPIKVRIPKSNPAPISDTQQVNPTAPDKVRRIDGQTASGLHWTVLNGDVRTALKLIPTEAINCAITSPPYYWQRDYEVDGQIGHEDSIAAYVHALVDVFRELRRTLKRDGTFFLNLGDTYYSAKGRPHGKDDKHSGRQMMRRHLRAVDGPGLGLPRKSLIGIPWRVAIAMQEDGWTLRSSIIWHRPASLPEPTAHDRPWRTFENVFLFSKSPKYWFDRTSLIGQEDIWMINSRPENPGAHFAPYPRELVERCLQCGCPSGGVVLDPFVGSGTTMAAALSKGSPAIGIDLKTEYSDFTVQRLRKDFDPTTY